MSTARLGEPGPRFASEDAAGGAVGPYEVVLEFTRAHRADDPYGFHDLRPQEYLLRMGQGGVKSAYFPWSERVLMDLAALARGEPDPVAARRLGEELRRFLDALDWGGHEDALEAEARSGRGPRLVVRSAAAELYSLPWELATFKDSGQHLADLRGFTLRYEWPREVRPAPAPSAREGRVLLAWSEAGGGVPEKEHQEALARASLEGGFGFEGRRDVLPKVSLEALEKTLREAVQADEPVAVLHLLCHGAPLGTSEDSHYGLVWNAPEGGRRLVDAGALGAVLGPYRDTLRMVVLCACHGGDGGALASHLGSLAQELHRVGIGMVVASRLPLSAEGSVVLARTLYEKLLVDSCSLEEALGAARRGLRVEVKGFDWASLQLYARRTGDADLRPVVLRPYQGLLPFGPSNRRFFFGRSRLEAELLARLGEAVRGQRPRFQVVAGASGAGKSSVVMAGLIPQLPPAEWDVLTVRPEALVRTMPRATGMRAEALRELRHRLHRLWSAEPMADEGRVEPHDVLVEVWRLRHARPQQRLLLVVDQLEEVFTHLDPVERRELMQALWALGREKELECVVVTTLRVDSFERCGEVVLDADTRLDAVVYAEKHRVFVPQMSPEELAEAIEKPAHRVGLYLEAGLVDRLCRDVGQEPGALPLLEHALDTLWRHREGHRLTHRAYEEMEGVAGSLVQTAEQLYDSLEEDERQQSRRLRAELVALGDETTPDTRRRVWLEDVRPSDPAEQAAFDRVLDKLVTARLVTRSTVGDGGGKVCLEVAHEALIRRWKRLRGWLQQNRRRLLQWRELRAMAEAWQLHRNEPEGGSSYLAVGARLGYARGIREEHQWQMTAPVREFLEACEEHEHRKVRSRRRRRMGLVLAMGVLAAVTFELTRRHLAALERLERIGRQGTQVHRGVARLCPRDDAKAECGELRQAADTFLVGLDAANEVPLLQDRVTHHMATGDTARMRGDLASASEEYRQALALTQDLLAKQPDTPLFKQMRVSIHASLGQLAHTRGLFKEALQHYLTHLELLDELLKHDPANAGLRDEHSRSLKRLAKLASDQAQSVKDAARPLGNPDP
ncbi:nSTAND1 domain-containing NTPase [Pyxidicoccus xibeiensis]|uniref:nSTAND1 domain-containing NTPase n=1 Tax=Pyxidicoccus xibeiensis TaxID=2906759 RepID=UPI0020A6DE86|nr:CHAT domain-containing protein [Pyxidicoccus xibeiensis]MCP3138997.1 CHAT domain-containing protein [Pyxidicoccus xibeiensis]